MPADCTIAADKNGRQTALRDLPATARAPARLPWWRRYRLARRLAGCFMAVTLAAAVVDFFNRGGTGADFIWVANGLLLAYLLLAPRWRWPAYLGAGFVAQLAATLLSQRHLHVWDLVFSGLNIAEVLIGALLLRRRSAQLPQFTNRAYLLRFLAYAVVAAPTAAGLVFTVISPLFSRATPAHAFLSWAAVDGLGTAVVTPAFVAVFQARFKSAANWRRNWDLSGTAGRRDGCRLFPNQGASAGAYLSAAGADSAQPGAGMGGAVHAVRCHRGRLVYPCGDRPADLLHVGRRRRAQLAPAILCRLRDAHALHRLRGPGKAAHR